MSWIKIMKVDSISENQLKAYQLNNEDILFVRHKGKITAFQNNCTHADVPLSIGWLNDEGRITCAMHHAEFDPNTGEHLAGPGNRSLKAFKTRNTDEWVEMLWENDGNQEIQVKEFNEANRNSLLEKIRNLSNELNSDID
jgi:nitrite reductase/ring-hydroxylating ferredoxin subunit